MYICMHTCIHIHIYIYIYIYIYTYASRPAAYSPRLGPGRPRPRRGLQAIISCMREYVIVILVSLVVLLLYVL